MVTINRFVIHEIKKEQNGVPNLILSESLPAVTEHATDLLRQLIERYKTRETYGKFTEDAGHHFPEAFETYSTVAATNETFLTFTIESMQTLNGQIANSVNARGGYFLFADYSNDLGGNHFSIFLVRNAQGFLFRREDQPLYDIQPQLHIELEKLAMACRINKDKFLSREQDDSNYLSFIRTNRQDTSNYFINWISATKLKRNTDYTDKLVDIIKQIELPATLGENIDVTRENLQRVVYDYCTNTVNSTINLTDLSSQLFGEENPSRIIDFAHQNEIAIDTEFSADKNRLKRLYKVRVSAEGISLQFDQSSFNDTIRIDPDQQDLIIIRSAELARKIQQEVRE